MGSVAAAAGAEGLRTRSRLGSALAWLDRESLLVALFAFYWVALLLRLPDALLSDSWMTLLYGRELWHGGLPHAAAPEPGDPLLRRHIAGALAQLSRSQKEAFVLVHMEGLSVREASALMGKPEGTVKSHLHRALQALRSELADLAEDTGGNAP